MVVITIIIVYNSNVNVYLCPAYGLLSCFSNQNMWGTGSGEFRFILNIINVGLAYQNADQVQLGEDQK